MQERMVQNASTHKISQMHDGSSSKILAPLSLDGVLFHRAQTDVSEATPQNHLTPDR
jgi:hypothetical protein